METDFSKVLYDKNCGLCNRIVTVVLKEGASKEGVLAAFALGNAMEGEPYIIHWRLVTAGRELSVVMDSLGNKEGELICQEDIDEVHFREDNTVLKFQ